MDSSLIVALVLALVAPFITSISTNRHQRKMKKYEIFEIHKSDVIEKYIKSAGQLSRSERIKTSRVGAERGG